MTGFKLTRRDGLVLLLLTLTTLAIYWPVTRAEFTNYDDPRYVIENGNIQSGVTWTSVKWAFSTGYASNWHPLTWISHMIDWQLYGSNPGKHHLTNLLFHIANTLLLFALLRVMTGTFWRSMFVSALFAWHPVHVESVAWVAERKDLLSTFFWMLAIWAYVAYARNPGWARYALSLLLFALGLMSKPMLVTLPFVLLLLDYWPLKRAGGWPDDTGSVQCKRFNWLHLILEKAPLFAMSAASCLATYYVQASGGAMKSLHHLSADAHIANALVSFVRYLGKIFWPTRLAVFYPYNELLPDWQIVGALLILLGITLWALRSSRQRPYVIVGWLWFLGTLVPVIGLVQVGETSMADRYLYVPALGIFIAVAWFAAESTAGWRATTRKGVLCLTAAVALGCCIIGTRAQITYWHDSVALFQHALDVAPDNQAGRYNLETAEYNLGQALSAKGKISDAMVHYTEALRVNPNYANAHNNLGLCLAMQGKFSDATNHYAKAVLLNPDNADAHYNYGLALSALGDPEGAIAQQSESLRLEPNQADTHYILGSLFVQKGRFDEAETQLSEAIKLRPDYVEAHTKLGLVLTQLGKGSEGATHYQEALRLNPDFIEALNNLAWIRAASSNPDLRNGGESVRLAQRACELTGNQQPVLLGTLAAGYAEAGRFTDAQATARKAAELAFATGQKELAARNQQLLELYQSNRPYHEVPESKADARP